MNNNDCSELFSDVSLEALSISYNSSFNNNKDSVNIDFCFGDEAKFSIILNEHNQWVIFVLESYFSEEQIRIIFDLLKCFNKKKDFDFWGKKLKRFLEEEDVDKSEISEDKVYYVSHLEHDKEIISKISKVIFSVLNNQRGVGDD